MASDNTILSVGDGAQLFTICLEGHDQSFQIQKKVLIEQSGFFRNMFKHDCKETRERKVTLHDDDPCAFDALFGFFHSGLHPDLIYNYVRSACAANGNSLGGFTVHGTMLQVYIMTDKYDLPKIRPQSVKNLDRFVVEFCHYPRGIDSKWSTHSERFIELHYNVVKEQLGDYPEDLLPFFTRFMLSDECSCEASAVDSALEDDPVLSVMIIQKLRGSHRTMQKDLRDKCDTISATVDQFEKYQASVKLSASNLQRELVDVEVNIRTLKSSASDTVRADLR